MGQPIHTKHLFIFFMYKSHPSLESYNNFVSIFIEQDLELTCEWGKPYDHLIVVNKTQERVYREFFVKFVSDRWLLPEQTVHNMTILWADTPKWLQTVSVIMVICVVVNSSRLTNFEQICLVFLLTILDFCSTHVFSTTYRAKKREHYCSENISTFTGVVQGQLYP